MGEIHPPGRGERKKATGGFQQEPTHAPSTPPRISAAETDSQELFNLEEEKGIFTDDDTTEDAQLKATFGPTQVVRKASSHPTTPSKQKVTWVQFPDFFYAYTLKQLPDYKERLSAWRVHQILTKLDNGTQRNIFIEESKVLSFSMICEEYTSGDLYISFISDAVVDGITFSNPIRPLLRAYIAYHELLAKKETKVHIWADPPDPGNTYIFTYTPPTSRPNADALKEMYSRFLSQCGLKPEAFAFSVNVPRLPAFGKKAEADIKQKHDLICQMAECLACMINLDFKRTVCATLPVSKRSDLFTTDTMPFSRTFPTEPELRSLLKYDSLDDAKNATSSFIQQWTGQGKGYLTQTAADLKRHAMHKLVPDACCKRLLETHNYSLTKDGTKCGYCDDKKPT